jgi:hypothetical protein
MRRSSISRSFHDTEESVQANMTEGQSKVLLAIQRRPFSDTLRVPIKYFEA